MIKVVTLLYIMRLWSLYVWSTVLPCVLIISTVRETDTGNSKVSMHLVLEYYLKVIESTLIAAMFLLLPIESLLPVGVPKMIPWKWSIGLVVFLLWMTEQMVKSGSTWVFGLRLVGRQLYGKKIAAR